MIISLHLSCAFSGPAFDYLDAPVIRVTGVDAPMPYTKSLENLMIPLQQDVVKAVHQLLNIQN